MVPDKESRKDVITTENMASHTAKGYDPENLAATDDLRAYAYEGDGSPAGSLASTVSGQKSL